jgi:pimeloyl-ACP methyl ester carboxylesterase
LRKGFYMDNLLLRTVFFLPGGVMPAALQYAPLLNVLKGEIRPVLHDLEVYAGDQPPPGYHLSHEVESLRQAADTEGIESFHLVGYSGGGVAAMAFVAAYPERVMSLALFEPSVIPSPEWLQAEAEYMDTLSQVMRLPPPDQMREFVRLHLRSDVQSPLPPLGDPPSWMSKRPAGLRAMAQAFASAKITYPAFRRFHQPVYLAIGDLSNPIEERKAETLARLFPDFKMEVYEGRHHFDPPQRAEPERFANALLNLWRRAEHVL